MSVTSVWVLAEHFLSVVFSDSFNCGQVCVPVRQQQQLVLTLEHQINTTCMNINLCCYVCNICYSGTLNFVLEVLIITPLPSPSSSYTTPLSHFVNT